MTDKLHYGLASNTPSASMDLGAQAAPLINVPGKLVCLDSLYGAVKSDPRHRLGISEMAAWSAHFPNALVGLAPDALQSLQERALQVPSQYGRVRPTQDSDADSQTMCGLV